MAEPVPEQRAVNAPVHTVESLRELLRKSERVYDKDRHDCWKTTPYVFYHPCLVILEDSYAVYDGGDCTDVHGGTSAVLPLPVYENLEKQLLETGQVIATVSGYYAEFEEGRDTYGHVDRRVPLHPAQIGVRINVTKDKAELYFLEFK